MCLSRTQTWRPHFTTLVKIANIISISNFFIFAFKRISRRNWKKFIDFFLLVIGWHPNRCAREQGLTQKSKIRLNIVKPVVAEECLAMLKVLLRTSAVATTEGLKKKSHRKIVSMPDAEGQTCLHVRLFVQRFPLCSASFYFQKQVFQGPFFPAKEKADFHAQSSPVLFSFFSQSVRKLKHPVV